jgi:hypothetical protein
MRDVASNINKLVRGLPNPKPIIIAFSRHHPDLIVSWGDGRVEAVLFLFTPPVRRCQIGVARPAAGT